jgi:hypothetical protein
MNTDELREKIWEQLFRAKVSKSIDEVAVLTRLWTDRCSGSRNKLNYG